MEEKKEYLKDADCKNCFFVKRKRNRAYCTRFPKEVEKYYVGRKSLKLIPLREQDVVYWCGEFIPK